nr:MAG TPA: hypothetical protein [Caudoviricetes sp.]
MAAPISALLFALYGSFLSSMAIVNCIAISAFVIKSPPFDRILPYGGEVSREDGTACKIELPVGGEMARALACERATSASLCAPDKGCRFPRF